MAPATFFLGRMRGFLRRVCGNRIRTRAGRTSHSRAGHKSSLVCAAAMAGSRPVNASTHLQSIESVHGASSARDPRFAGKPGVDIWHKSERRA